MLTFLEHWLLRILFLIAVLLIAGSLLRTVQHLQSLIEGGSNIQSNPKAVEVEQRFIDTHQKKISLPDLTSDQLESPF